MTQPIRIGIVGCGRVMRGPYMRLIETLRIRNLVEVVVACDIKTELEAVVKEEFGIAKFSSDYRQVVESEEVDLVLVLTSMREHGPITLAALEAGKHVLVEKPMSVDLAEAARIVALSKTSPGYLVCAPHVILSPTYQTMWQRIKRGEIGQVLSARANYGHAGPTWGPWFYQPGGGALFDLGVYNVTSLTGFIGPVQRVTAMAGVAIPERVVDGQMIEVEAEDNAHVLLDFGDSVFAVVSTGFTLQKYRCPAIEIYGSQGTIQMLKDDWDPDGYELWQNEVGAWQIFAETDPNWPWTDGLRHLVESIQNQVEPLISPDHAYHVLEVMLKAQEAGRDGQAKQIESTCPPLRLQAEVETAAPHLVHDRSQT